MTDLYLPKDEIETICSYFELGFSNAAVVNILDVPLKEVIDIRDGRSHPEISVKYVFEHIDSTKILVHSIIEQYNELIANIDDDDGLCIPEMIASIENVDIDYVLNVLGIELT